MIVELLTCANIGLINSNSFSHFLFTSCFILPKFSIQNMKNYSYFILTSI